MSNDRMRERIRRADRFPAGWYLWMAFCLMVGLAGMAVTIWVGYRVGAHLGVW